MYVMVGSANPVKVAAVERALERFDPTVVARAVDSGVAEQPRSTRETVAGAENRARRALEAGDVAAGDAAYGVGLEGGVTRFEGAPGLYLVMWAAVTDGETIGRGAARASDCPRGSPSAWNRARNSAPRWTTSARGRTSPRTKARWACSPTD